ncbi:hypothetical protein FQN50_008194 [Emmonsiellopsis sp. PD_5]|nr:hypothetical protein FQN50_008194 [Emmonsiellopsis sp. PD_5]
MEGQARPIYHATIACRKTLQQCVNLPALMNDEWARKRLADFNLWASGSGASAGERASLDERLASKPDARVVVTNLLLLLQRLLVHCQRVGTGGAEETPILSDHVVAQDDYYDRSDDSDSSSDDSNPDIPLSKATDDVEAIINQLVRISIAIRRAGIPARLERADHAFDPARHRELWDFLALLIHLTTLSEDDKRLGRLKAGPPPSSMTGVQSRLIEANLKRRHRFLYAEKRWRKQTRERATRHSTSLTQEDSESYVVVHSSHSTTVNREQVVKSKKPSEHQEQRELPCPKTPEAAPTLTSTSPTAIRDEIVIPAGTQAPTSIASATSAKVAYPKAPEVLLGQIAFRCPCCQLTLPISNSRGVRWKKHLREDILPYTCVLEDCPQPHRLYTSREEWVKHMEADHIGSQHWVCFACTSMQPTKFTEEQDFVHHLQSDHRDHISPDQISFVVEESACTEPPTVSSCPLCPPPPPSPSFDVEIDAGSLLYHVAQHIHSFSLYSLPWPAHGQMEREYVGVEAEEEAAINEKYYFALSSGNGSLHQAQNSVSESTEQDGSTESSSQHSTDRPGSPTTDGHFSDTHGDDEYQQEDTGESNEEVSDDPTTDDTGAIGSENWDFISTRLTTTATYNPHDDPIMQSFAAHQSNQHNEESGDLHYLGRELAEFISNPPKVYNPLSYLGPELEYFVIHPPKMTYPEGFKYDLDDSIAAQLSKEFSQSCLAREVELFFSIPPRGFTHWARDT